MSGYVYWCNAAVPAAHVAVGDAFGGIVGSEPGDATAFSAGIKLRAIGGPDSVVAYGVAVAIKAAALAAIDEFNSAGPYPILSAGGAAPEQIAGAKSVLHVEAGARNIVEPQALAFWASLGYEPVVTTLP